MPRRPLVIAILAIMAVALLAPIVLLALARPAAHGTPSSPVPIASASSSAAPQQDPANVLDPRRMLWSFAQPHFENGLVGKAYSLQAGDLAADAPIVDLEVPWIIRGEDPGRMPAIAAPAGGTVAFVADDGNRSQLHRVAIRRDAVPELVADLEQIVWDLDVDPAGTTAYLAVLNRDGSDGGVLVTPLDGSAAPRSLMPPAIIGAPDDGMRLAAVLPFGARLDVSLDGGYLARNICSDAGCRNEVMELATGLVVDIGERQPIGVFGHVLVHSSCDVRRCGAVALDLRTGAERQLGQLERQAVLLGHAAGPVLVVEADLQQDGRAVAVNGIALASGEETELARAPEGGEISVVTPHAFDSLQLSLPPSVALVDVHDAGSRRLAIDVVSGERIEVPAPPIRQAPGPIPQG